MTELREKRLLYLATRSINHKPYYSQYRQLMYKGYIRWTLGFASLTELGQQRLEELS